MKECNENETKLENICDKYPIIQRLDDARIFCLYFGEGEWDEPFNELIIKDMCDFYFYDTLNSKDCEQLSKCFAEISELLKELEERK